MFQNLPKSLRLFSFFRIPIEIHIYFVMYVVYRLLISFIFYPNARLAPIEFFGLHFGSAFILFSTVIIHELAECFVARRLAGQVEKITVWPFGGFHYCASHINPYEQLIISFTGLATHIPLAGLWFGVWYETVHPECNEGFTFWQMVLPKYCLEFDLMLQGFQIQFFIFIFNLVPVYPLDGGKILISLLVMFGKTPPTIFKVCFVISLLILGLLIAMTVMTLNAFSGLFCLCVLYQIFTMVRNYIAGHISQHPLFQNCPCPAKKVKTVSQLDDMEGYYNI